MIFQPGLKHSHFFETASEAFRFKMAPVINFILLVSYEETKAMVTNGSILQERERNIPLRKPQKAVPF